MERNKLSPKFVEELKDTTQFTLPNGDDSSIGSDLVGWNNIKKLLDEGVAGGTLFDNGGAGGVFSTYSLVYTSSNAYAGGVLAPNGDIHFVPYAAPVGQKVSPNGTVSTYSLVYSTGADAYAGGVLAPNGDIHFVPFATPVGQKVSPNGTVSTYSLAYTGTTEVPYPGYYGGVLAPNGDIHFVPYFADRGQKVSPNGTVSTYSLAYTAVFPESEYPIGGYVGGVLAPNGDIHFVPIYASIGQKVNISGTVSTYSLVYTGIPEISYPGYFSGVLAPNGDIHFIPGILAIGQKVSANGTVSIYSLNESSYFSGNGGAILSPNGDIHIIPSYNSYGSKLSIQSGVKFPIGVCLSSFFNKF